MEALAERLAGEAIEINIGAQDLSSLSVELECTRAGRDNRSSASVRLPLFSDDAFLKRVEDIMMYIHF